MKKVINFFILFIFYTTFCQSLAQNVTNLSNNQGDFVQKDIKKIEIYSENNKFGLKSNNIPITEAKYQKLIKIGDNAWIIQKKNKFGLINSNGEIIAKPIYTHADRLLGSFAKLGSERNYGLYNKNGDLIIPHEYSIISPMFNELFLTCKNYKYGIINSQGKILIKNEFDEIYMPDKTTLRIEHEGEWYELKEVSSSHVTLPNELKPVIFNNKKFTITKLVTNTGLVSGYSVVSFTDYLLKLFSSISPAYEQTIDELMFSKGVDSVPIIMKLTWVPRFPIVYGKKYYNNLKSPHTGPLGDVKKTFKKKIQ